MCTAVSRVQFLLGVSPELWLYCAVAMAVAAIRKLSDTTVLLWPWLWLYCVAVAVAALWLYCVAVAVAVAAIREFNIELHVSGAAMLCQPNMNNTQPVRPPVLKTPGPNQLYKLLPQPIL